MSERYTKKDAERAMQRLAEMFGKRVGHYRKVTEGEPPSSNAWVSANGAYCVNPGAWELDYSPHYGGYVVQEISAEGGTGVSLPFGDARRSAREFWQMVRDIENALRLRDAVAS